jgi:hypothetical protein
VFLDTFQPSHAKPAELVLRACDQIFHGARYEHFARLCAADRPGGPVERGEEAVSRRVHLLVWETGKLLADESMVPRE